MMERAGGVILCELSVITRTGTRCQPRGKEFLRVKVSFARTKHTRWAMYSRVNGLDHAAELIS